MSEEEPNGVSKEHMTWAKRFVLWGPAGAGVYILAHAVVQWLWGDIERPITTRMQALADTLAMESKLRVEAQAEGQRRDIILAGELRHIVQDRLGMIEVMGAPEGPKRDLAIMRMRAQWEAETTQTDHHLLP